MPVRATHGTRRRSQRRPARPLIAEGGGHRGREQRQVVLRRPRRLAHSRDFRDGARAVLADAALDDTGVLAGHGPLGRVVAAALRAEDQEPVQFLLRWGPISSYGAKTDSSSTSKVWDAALHRRGTTG